MNALPGCEDFRAAHGMTQVAHRAIFGVVLPGQFDMQRVNRRTKPRKHRMKRTRYSHLGTPVEEWLDDIATTVLNVLKNYVIYKSLFCIGLQTKKLLLLREICNCRLFMLEFDWLPPGIYCNVEKSERRAVIGTNCIAWHDRD